MTEPTPPQEPAAPPAPPPGAKAWVLNWLARHKFLAIVALLVGSCSFTLRDRHVSWEEEVPLNTGETIWVKREILYTYRGGSGNPLDMKHRPNWTETLGFEWRGKQYSYTGDADIMLIAISPITNKPVLVAWAGNKGWDDHHLYRCTVPFYVQFYQDMPDSPWRWPSGIEPWLYDLPYNVMMHKPRLGEVQDKYSSQDRQRLDHTAAVQSPNYAKIDRTHRADNCIK